MKDKVKNILLAIITSFATVFNFYNVAFEKFDIFTLINTILFILITFSYMYLFKKIKLNNSKRNIIISIIFSICSTVSNIVRNLGTIRYIVNPFSIFIFIGFYYFSLLILSILENIKIKELKSKNSVIDLFKEKTFLVSFILIFISFLIYIIIYYPCTIDTDPILQIIQFLNHFEEGFPYVPYIKDMWHLSNHYPIMHTLLLGTFFKFGRALGSDNLGLFLYVFIQSIIFALTLARTILVLKRRNVRTGYLLFMLICYMFLPMYGFYTVNLNKDVYYAILIINLVIEIFNYLEKKSISIKKLIIWFIILALICLFRNNGIYVVLIIFPFVTFVYRKNALKIGTMFILIIGLYYTFDKVMLPKFDVYPSSVREALSVPFQQTARYIKYHDEEVTDEEKEAINKVLDYKVIKREYLPEISDPVKETFKKDSTKKDLINYFKVWFKMGLKHPVEYIDATLNNMYGYFDIYSNSKYLYYIEYPREVFNDTKIDFHFEGPLALRIIPNIFASFVLFVPILRLTCNIGFNNLLIIFLGIDLIFRKEKKYLIALLPLYVTALICIVSPVNTYFRYALPFVFCFPFTIGMYLHILKKGNN